VAVGRALMTKPTVLMLDEPTAGVSPIVMDELFDRIIEIATPARHPDGRAERPPGAQHRRPGYVLVRAKTGTPAPATNLLARSRSPANRVPGG
jgi:branched-chain amino acid transport system ATP-binding protein